MRWLLMLAAIIMAPASALAQPWQPRDGERIVFDVLRNGGSFGTHVVAFSRQGDALTVDTDIELRVAFGPITLFEYIHDATETYVDGRLLRLGARTKKDGRWKTLSAQATEAGLKVAGEAFSGVLTGRVIPSTHWNVDQMKQPAMFSTETGEMLPMSVADRGIERVRTANGMIEARRYDVKSDLDASFWYDAQGRWVKCAFVAEGSKIEYVLRN